MKLNKKLLIYEYMWHTELIKSYLWKSKCIHILYNYDYNYITLRHLKWFCGGFIYIKLYEYNLSVINTLFYTQKSYLNFE